MPLTARHVAAALALVAAAGCAHGSLPGTAAIPIHAGQPSFRPVLAPFPVLGAPPWPLELAFFGGLNAPRPQLVDADGDGDLDLFVQEVSGRVAFFEREGTRDGFPHFVFRTDKYGGIDVGEWYRFADMDADGDLDLLAEQPFSYIKYYRNDGGRGASRFVLAADTLHDTDGKPIFSDRQNIPQLVDLDCDRRADLMIGRLDGTVARYEAVDSGASGRGGAPAFRLVASEFEDIRIIGQGGEQAPLPSNPQEFGPSLHGANTMALADYDGDGDLDLFWGDFFEPGLLLIPNTGTCAAPNFRSQPIKFPEGRPIQTSGYNAPTFGDVNGDGRLDLVLGVLGGAFNPPRTAAENLYYLVQAGDGRWPLRSQQLLPMVDIGSETIPAVADLDEDGDLDLLLANKLDPHNLTTSRIMWFENMGSKTRPSLRPRGLLPLTGRYHFAPAFGDLDGDGHLDLLLGEWGPRVAWYRPTPRSVGGFTPVDTALVTIGRGSNTVPTLGDVDGDGDLDLLIGEASGWLNYYRNDGTRAAPRFVLVSEEFQGLKVGRRSAPHLADMDKDGDLDLLVGSDADGLVLFRNVGTRSAPRFERDSRFTVTVPGLSAPAAGDFDGDGDLDLIVGGMGGAVYLEQH